MNYRWLIAGVVAVGLSALAAAPASAQGYSHHEDTYQGPHGGYTHHEDSSYGGGYSHHEDRSYGGGYYGDDYGGRGGYGRGYGGGYGRRDYGSRRSSFLGLNFNLNIGGHSHGGGGGHRDVYRGGHRDIYRGGHRDVYRGGHGGYRGHGGHH